MVRWASLCFSHCVCAMRLLTGGGAPALQEFRH